MLPIEIHARISDFLNLKDYFNFSIVNTTLYRGLAKYNEFPLPISEYQRETYKSLSSDSKSIIVRSLHFTGINNVIINYVIEKAKKNHKIIIRSSSEWWERMLKKLNVSFLCIKEEEDVIKGPYPSVVLLNNFKLFYYLLRYFSPSICIFDPHYHFEGDFKSINLSHRLSRSYCDKYDSYYAYSAIPFFSISSFYISGPLRASIQKILSSHSKITFLSVSRSHFSFFKDETYLVFEPNDKKSFDSSKEKSILFYREADLRDTAPYLEGVILVQIDGSVSSHLTAGVFELILASSSITHIYYHTRSFGNKPPIQFIKSIVLREIKKRLILLRAEEDPFIPFVESFDFSSFFPSPSPSPSLDYFWNSRSIVMNLYELYKEKNNETSKISTLLEGKEIVY